VYSLDGEAGNLCVVCCRDKWNCEHHETC